MEQLFEIAAPQARTFSSSIVGEGFNDGGGAGIALSPSIRTAGGKLTDMSWPPAKTGM